MSTNNDAVRQYTAKVGEWPKSSAVDPEEQRIGLCLKSYGEGNDKYKEGSLYPIGCDAVQSLWRVVCDREEFVEFLFDNAPPQATHFTFTEEDYGATFWSEVDGNWYTWPIFGTKWLFTMINPLCDDSIVLIPRPVKTTQQPEVEVYTPLPGELCEVLHGGVWHETRVIGTDSRGYYVYECGEFDSSTPYCVTSAKVANFRRMLTERDKKAVKIYRRENPNTGLSDHEISNLVDFATYLAKWDALVEEWEYLHEN